MCRRRHGVHLPVAIEELRISGIPSLKELSNLKLVTNIPDMRLYIKSSSGVAIKTYNWFLLEELGMKGHFEYFSFPRY